MGFDSESKKSIQRQKEGQNQQGFCSSKKKSTKNKLFHNCNLMLK